MADTHDDGSPATPAMASDQETLVRRLAAHPFTRGMTEDFLRRLAEVSMAKTFDAGERIFSNGEPANRFYLIERGEVVLETEDEERGDRVVIDRVGEGDVLGWSWLFEPYYWRFDARAVSATSAVFLYGTRLREEAEADPQFGYELLKRTSAIVVQRLQVTRKRLLAKRAKYL